MPINLVFRKVVLFMENEILSSVGLTCGRGINAEKIWNIKKCIIVAKEINKGIESATDV